MDSRLIEAVAELNRTAPRSFLRDENEPSFTTREEILKFRQIEADRISTNINGNRSSSNGNGNGGQMALTRDIPKEIKSLYSKEGLEEKILKIVSFPDGNEVKINYITRKGNSGNVPCVLYLHGGGMAASSAFDPTYKCFCRMLAKENVSVAVVDFRNCEVPTASNNLISPFPGGLNDCYSALLYLYDNRVKLNISSIIIAGESGGGNLSIALSLKCKQMNQLHLFTSVYAMCPYIAGRWPKDVRNKGILGTSHIDNNGIFIYLPSNLNSALGYGIDEFERKNILAWPGFATVEDLKGLPPFFITVNELDPLRDEGINFYRLLRQAEVDAQCLCKIGTCHGGEQFVGDVPEISIQTVQSISNFAYRMEKRDKRTIVASKL